MKKFALAFASLALFAACGVVQDDIDPIEEPPPVEQPEPGEEPPVEPPVEPPIEPLIAEEDGDSLNDPAQSVFMSITGNRELSHTDAISHPTGDDTDFVEFELPNNSNPSQRVFVTLEGFVDSDSDAIVHATLFEDGEETTTKVLLNEGEVNVTVDNTKVQTLRIGFTSVDDIAFVDYTLTVVAFR